MRVLLLVNPVASATTSARRRRVEQLVGGRHRLDVAETEGRGHATELAAAAAGAGVDVVVVFGGDGTLNEAANGLVGTETALAALPGGSINVLARTLGFRNQVDAAGQQLVEALAHGSRRRIGVGCANGRRFLIVLGVGFDAAVIAHAERLAERIPELKRWLTPSVFALTALGTLLAGYDRKQPRVSAEADGEPLGNASYAVISNLTPYAYLGSRPFVVTRQAGPDRALAVTMFSRLRLTGMALAATQALTRGIQDGADVILRSDVGQVTISAKGAGVPWHVDGDYLGIVEQLDISYEPDSLALVVPST